jgi:L-ascorbate metabolism protein UlaG (beta-lactamase superfamily)
MAIDSHGAADVSDTAMAAGRTGARASSRTKAHSARWRWVADWAKVRPGTLRLADALGRGRGRLRMLDEWRGFAPPAGLRPDCSTWDQLGDGELAVAWLGHATMLIRVGGMTVLTDPVLSDRIGLGLGLLTAGPQRHLAPALSVSELPAIDLILLSHAHFDHLDRPTLVRLNKSVPVVTASRTSDLVSDLGFRHVRELRWGESCRLGPLLITSHRVRHWGARTFYDTYRGYNSYLLESSRSRVLFGGDTAFQEDFRDLTRVDMAIMGIGAYNPWVQSHATPEQAWDMANHARADWIVPMHHSTFKLSYEPVTEPLERILTAAGGGVDRIAIQRIGQTWRSSTPATT